VKLIKEVDIEAATEGAEESKAGDRVLVDIFSDAKFVDVIGTSKGALCGCGAQARIRGRAQVARTHVPGPGLDRRVQFPSRVFLGSACRGTWHDQVRCAICAFAASISKRIC